MQRSGKSGRPTSRIESKNHVVRPHRKEVHRWDDDLPVPLLSKRAALTVVFFAAVLCFINSHDATFVFDDSEAIINNKDLTAEVPLLKLFRHDFWGSRIDSNTSHKSYRPLTVLTFRLNCYLSQGLHPWGFHVVNIILHAVVSAVSLLVFSTLITDPEANRDDDGPWVLQEPHFSVAAVVGRADLLCALCFFLSFLCYAKSCKTGCKGTDRPPTSFSVPWMCVSMTLCAVSILCKEQGVTVLGVCSAYDIIIMCQCDPLHIVHRVQGVPPTSNGKGHTQEGKDWQQSLLLRHLVIGVTGICILVARFRIMGSSPPVFQVVDNPHSFHNSTIMRAVNYNYLYSLNAWLLLNPWWLCFDWSMGCVPVIESLADVRVLAPVLLWCILGSLIYLCVLGSPSQHKRVLSMALVMLIVPFLPATNLLFRVGFVIAERVLYLSAAGSCMLVVLGATVLSHRQTYNKVLQVSIVVLVGAFVIRSIHRSNDWRKEKTLFESGAEVCPLNAKVHYNIGKIHGDAGNVDIAIQEYREAIRLNDKYDQAMNNLANILKDQGQLTQAEALLRTAVSIRADFAAAWMNLGIVQAALRKNESAERSYFEALKHRKRYPDCYYNLGNLYLDMGRLKDALVAWRNATLQKPTHVNAWSNILILLDNQGKLEEVSIVAQEALSFLPHEAILHYNVANSYGKASRYKESEMYFMKAIQLDPRNPSYHSNLGVLYHRWGKYKKAMECYQKALQLDPGSKHTEENLMMLERKMASTQR